MIPAAMAVHWVFSFVVDLDMLPLWPTLSMTLALPRSLSHRDQRSFFVFAALVPIQKTRLDKAVLRRRIFFFLAKKNVTDRTEGRVG